MIISYNIRFARRSAKRGALVFCIYEQFSGIIVVSLYTDGDVMPDLNTDHLLRSEVSGCLNDDIDKLKTIFHYPDNDEIIFRRINGVNSRLCAVFIDGMVDSEQMSNFVIRALQWNNTTPPQKSLSDCFTEKTLQISQITTDTIMSEIVKMILSGMTALFAEGMTEAIVMDTRGYERRKVDKANKERVVMGSQEGFVEDLRANLTLIHRYIQSSELMCHKLTVGTGIPLRIAVLHVNGVVDDNALEELNRRLKTVDKAVVHGIGELQQCIEDDPWAIMPQMLLTERPDRAAAALADGQFVIVADASPYALIGPCGVFTFLQTSDDAFSRWQYGTYSRVIRYIGLMLALLLPGLYVALTMYHTHLIPMSLLSAIAETRAKVPFPILFEVGVMELSFFLINEANMRIPQQIGSFIGIIGALVLGQAAVDASIISPILIIIIAVSGLGCYAMPDYSVAIALILYRLVIIAAGAMFGLFGISLALFAIGCQLCGMRSFGVGYLSPIAPHRPHNPDITLRLPAFMQKRILYLVPEGSWIRRVGSSGRKAKRNEDEQ